MLNSGDIDKNSHDMSILHMVHVDDVAQAHIFLLEHPNPKGRYNLSAFPRVVDEIIDIISSKYPEIKISKSKWVIPMKSWNLNLCNLCSIVINIVTSIIIHIIFFCYRMLMGAKCEKLPHLTCKKIMDAGFEFKYNIEEMIEDTIECCKKNGYLWTKKLTRWMMKINQ